MCKCPRCGKEINDDSDNNIKEHRKFTSRVCDYCGYIDFYGNYFK